MDGVAIKVYEKIQSTVEEKLGYEIVDVEYIKKKGDLHLTIYIYKKEGITHDDCERVHLAIDPIIEELDPSGEQMYFLNVSSPGLDRPFKTFRDFERNYGNEVELKLYAPLMGKKLYEGVLLEKTDTTVTLELPKVGAKAFELNKVALVRPLVKFD